MFKQHPGSQLAFYIDMRDDDDEQAFLNATRWCSEHVGPYPETWTLDVFYLEPKHATFIFKGVAEAALFKLRWV